MSLSLSLCPSLFPPLFCFPSLSVSLSLPPFSLSLPVPFTLFVFSPLSFPYLAPSLPFLAKVLLEVQYHMRLLPLIFTSGAGIRASTCMLLRESVAHLIYGSSFKLLRLLTVPACLVYADAQSVGVSEMAPYPLCIAPLLTRAWFRKSILRLRSLLEPS